MAQPETSHYEKLSQKGLFHKGVVVSWIYHGVRLFHGKSLMLVASGPSNLTRHTLRSDQIEIWD